MSYPEVEFGEEDRRVIARVTLPDEDDRGFLSVDLSFEAGSAGLADYLASELCEQFGDAIRKVKKAAYDRGYDDGRGRRRRASEADFFRSLDPRV